MRPSGTWPSRKWNHCHTAFASGDRKWTKIGSVFAPHCLTANNHTAPKRGPLCGPQNATKGGATVATFCDSQNGPWPASSPMAGCPWQASGRGSDSSVVEIVASISSPQRCGPDATRQRPSPGRCCYLWLRRTAFPKRIAVEARRPARCSAPQSSGANVHPPPISVPRSVPFAGCLHWAGVSTGVSRKRESNSCVQVATSSSMTRD